jgi:excisionase family DNA binding protein
MATQQTQTTAPAPVERLVYTISETCEALGISETHCRMLLRTNRLPHIRLGRRVLVSRAAVLRMLPDQGAAEASQG